MRGARCVAVLLACLLPQLTAAAPRPGAPAPDFALKALSGENLRLSEFRGEVVLLTFWASWCGRCLDQLAALDRLAERYSGQAVHFVAVSIDADAHRARAAGERLGFPVLLDADGSIARAYAIDRMPLTLLVDADGELRHAHESYRGGDELNYAAELDALLVERGR